LSLDTPPKDGRSRRGTLAQHNREPDLFRRIADRAKALFDDGLLYEVIASELECDRTTVREALRFWHESRGLALPDGRSRRKTLPRKQRPAT